MEDKFYSVEGCEDLASEISEFVDTFKYLMNIPQDNPDSKALTPELLEAFDSVAGAVEDMLHSYNYYKEAKHYLAKDEDELLKMCRKR